MLDDRVAAIAIAFTVLVSSIQGIFRFAKYRSQVYREWVPQRAPRIIAGLDELSIEIIHELHRIIRADYGYTSTGEFWPIGPPPNLSQFKHMINMYERAQTYKERIKSDIRLLMNLGKVLVSSLSLMAVAAVMVIIHYSMDWEGTATAVIGFASGALALLALILALVIHVYLNDRLTNAEVLSNERVQNA